MVIPKEDVLLKTRPKHSKCPVALDQSILKSSCIKTTASGLSYYELGVNGEKKLMETGTLIKMGIAHLTP